MRNHFTKECIINKIKELYKISGKIPTRKLWKNTTDKPCSTNTIERIFGKWSDIVKEALGRSYYDDRHPEQLVKCKQCEKEFYKAYNQIKITTNHFCSLSCSCKYSCNLMNVINKKKRKYTNKCCNCDILISSKLRYCKMCYEIKMKELNNRPIGSLLYKGSNKYSLIRDRARRATKNRPQSCVVCGYSKHVECSHIRPIHDFPLDTLLCEVNSEANLVLLCPNCHWEFDHNILDISPYIMRI